MKIKEGGGMDLQKEREAFEVWHYEQYLLENPNIDISSAKYIYDYAHKNALVCQLRESHFTAWQAAKAQAVPEWISVEDSLPKKNANVLLNVVARRRGKPFSCIGFYSVEPDDEPCFILDDNFTILKGVTHWMLLPDAPQEPAND